MPDLLLGYLLVGAVLSVGATKWWGVPACTVGWLPLIALYVYLDGRMG